MNFIISLPRCTVKAQGKVLLTVPAQETSRNDIWAAPGALTGQRLPK
jgi:hypothetical protein